MAVDGKRVVAFTPYGRELTISLLKDYMVRDHERGIVDEWWLLMNTDPYQTDDVAYAKKLARKHKWIKMIERPVDPPLHPKQLNTGTFYRYMTDEDTVFVRFDDDIVYVEENAIERLASARIHKKHPFIIFPVIWNNAIVSYYLQQFGIIPLDYGVVKSAHCVDPVGWADWVFAEHIHHHLIDKVLSNNVEELFLHHDIQLPLAQQFSVSCFAQDGAEYAKVGDIKSEEESWHTIEKPYETERNNLILSNSLVSHFSFFHQREPLLKTDVLQLYRQIADDKCL